MILALHTIKILKFILLGKLLHINENSKFRDLEKEKEKFEIQN